MPIRLFICQTEQCYRISISLDNRFSVIQHRNPGLDQCFLQNFPFAALMLMVAADKIHGRVGHQCVNEFHCTVYVCSVLMPIYKISGNHNNIRTALFDFTQERLLSPPEYLILQIRNLQNFIAVEAGRNLPSVCHFCQNQSIILPIKKCP